ncbi:MAG: DUF952 domain-containing protein [Robiginitomaculum sp.]
MTSLYKILRPEQWREFQARGLFTGAPVDIADGYIHFSTGEQARETAAKHFADCERIVLLKVDSAALPKALAQALKWEVSRGGALFPHLYANLPLDCIAGSWEITNTDSGFDFPAEI